MVPRLNEVLWIVDLNRQSLDRVVPVSPATASGICSPLQAGTRSCSSTGPPAGAVRSGRWRAARAPHRRHEQRGVPVLLRLPPDELRDALAGAAPSAPASAGCSATSKMTPSPQPPQPRRPRPGDLLHAFAAADRVTDGRRSSWRTHKGLAYPPKVIRQPLGAALGRTVAPARPRPWRRPDDPWANFPPGSPEATACAAAPAPGRPEPVPRPDKPARRLRAATGAWSRPSKPSGASCSTCPGCARGGRPVVTVSPDVASSPTWAAGSTRSVCGTWTSMGTGSNGTGPPSSIGASPKGPAHRARHRRGQPGRASLRAGPHLVA